MSLLFPCSQISFHHLPGRFYVLRVVLVSSFQFAFSPPPFYTVLTGPRQGRVCMKGGVFINKLHNSGDVGFCYKEGHTSSMLLTWDGDVVVDIDCPYKTCGFANQCEMYQRHPVGFKQNYPSSERSE